MNIAVQQYPSATFTLNEERDTWHCSHAEAYIERACCSGFQAGLQVCGCAGRDGILCPARDCDGIEDWEAETLFYRLEWVVK